MSNTIGNQLSNMVKTCDVSIKCDLCEFDYICRKLNSTPHDLLEDFKELGLKVDEYEPILKKAISQNGEYGQLDICIEEMAELTQAISKLKRGLTHNVEEEVADVEIMLEQVRMMFLVDAKKIDEIKKQKLERLEKRLEGNE